MMGDTTGFPVALVRLLFLSILLVSEIKCFQNFGEQSFNYDRNLRSKCSFSKGSSFGQNDCFHAPKMIKGQMSMIQKPPQEKVAKVYNLPETVELQRNYIDQICSDLPKDHAAITYQPGAKVLCSLPCSCLHQAQPFLTSLGEIKEVLAAVPGGDKLDEDCGHEQQAVAYEFHFDSSVDEKTAVPPRTLPSPHSVNHLSWAQVLASWLLAALRSARWQSVLERFPGILKTKIKGITSSLETRLSLTKDPPPPSLLLGKKQNALSKVWAGHVLSKELCGSFSDSQLFSKLEDNCQQLLLVDFLEQEKVQQIADAVKCAMSKHFGFSESEININMQFMTLESASSIQSQTSTRTPSLLEAIILLNPQKQPQDPIHEDPSIHFRFLNGAMRFSSCNEGMGFLFSGKRLHQVKWIQNPDEINQFDFLRVSAQVLSPCLRADIPLWSFGLPTWHVSTPEVSDEEILNRCYVFNSSLDLPLLKNINYQSDIKEESDLSFHIQRSPPWSDQVRLYFYQKRKRFTGILSLGKAIEVGNCYTILNKRTDSLMDKTVNSLFQNSLTKVRVAPMVSVFVEPEFRGGVVGILLMRKLLKYLNSKNYQYMIITVDDNGSGKLFNWYESLGFKHAERIDSKAMITDIKNPLAFPDDNKQ